MINTLKMEFKHVFINWQLGSFEVFIIKHNHLKVLSLSPSTYCRVMSGGSVFHLIQGRKYGREERELETLVNVTENIY